MEEFKHYKDICKENTRISSRVVDEFLIYFAAERNNLEKTMNRKFSRYRHVTDDFPKEWLNMLKSQYIAHRIFREDGLVHGYLKHPGLKHLRQEEMDYLVKQSENPWRFSFSTIIDRPYPDFYLMQDIFTDELFTLYSPGVTKTEDSQPVNLWFNMVAFNGACWQSYGPIGFYQSFDPDDIFFFASELNPEIENEYDLLIDIEDDPIPYMMILSGANYPVIVNKKDQIVHVQAEYEVNEFDTKKFKEYFKTEYNDSVYRLTLNRWGSHPHFSQAYYDETNKTILLSAMTDRGFSALIEAFNKIGYDFPDESFIRVSPMMVKTASDILGRDIDLLRYEKLFTRDTPPDQADELSKLNLFLDLAVPEINAGRIPDIEALAKKAGIDPGMAKSITEDVMKKRNR